MRGCDVSERITEADLRRWENDKAYESRAMARPPIIVLVAEVRRLRGLIVEGAVRIDAVEYTDRWQALEAEVRAIREEQASLDTGA